MNMTRRSMMLTLAAFAAPAATLGGCGGGVGSGGTGDFSSSFTYGQITGFGSVIVNGVRFDDSEASVVDDRGGARSRDDLRLGMTVSIDSGTVTQDSTGPQARASVVRFGSVLEAPVSSVDTTSNSFVALGQTVRLQATTVFDDSLGGGGLAALAGTAVEVHGYLDAATQSIIATRVEGFTAAGEYKARGVIVSVDASARSLRMGSADFDFSSAGDVPAGLAAGQALTLVVRTTPDGAGRWAVIRFRSGSLSRPSRDHDDADVRGVVTAFTDTRRFTVNDTVVDASAAVFSDGTSFGLGSRVKVEGSYRGGVLVAREVEIDDGGRDDDGRIDLRGAIESVDALAKTLRLRGNTVDFGGAVDFRRGSAADLAVGRRVKVKGNLSADGTRVIAEEIEFE